ncbi:UDP-N-acetylmuramoyl-L-alanyl-D-glutamate--2,6-diaminopimelate ligase [Desulfurobacterium sp.]
MKLSTLIRNLNLEKIHFKDCNVTCISEDSRSVIPGCLFFAIEGFKRDGHNYIESAISKGAVAVIGTNREILKKFAGKGIAVLVARNVRKIEGIVAHRFFGEPSRKLKLIGITGTNGKTTTSFILYNALKNAGHKTGLIGTVEYITPLNREKAERTTPPPIKLNALLKQMADEGAEYAIMEVSSHAVSLSRIEGLTFHAGVFTNLSPEHLDFYPDIYDYFLAKYNFTKHITPGGFLLTNSDDFFGKVIEGIRAARAFEVVSYGKSGKLKIENIETEPHGTHITISFEGKIFNLHTNLKGKYNAYNVTAAFGVLIKSGMENAADYLKETYIPGRLEEVAPGIYIDYAHTPDALKNVLKTLKEVYPDRKLTVVFGCGGNRDRHKRPEMGKIASEIADRVIVTTDNPRFENPEEIINDILRGCATGKTTVIPDRKTAIKFAVEENDSIILIAGKGHEDYQEIKGKKYKFSDRAAVTEVIGEIKRNSQHNKRHR